MRKWLVGLLAAGLCVSSAWADTVTYTVKSKTEVEVSSGAAPEGATAEYVATANNVCQITSNNTATLTLKGYSGATITGLTLSMKSNSSKGKGSLSVTSGDAVIAAIEDSNFNSENWHGAWSTEYVDVKPSVTATAIDDDVVILISGSVNSLYCQSYTIEYTLGEPLPVEFSIALDPNEAFEVVQGKSESITATVKGAQGDVTYSWSVDGTPIELAGNVYAIDSTEVGGPYEVACEASDGTSSDSASVKYTVVEAPVVTGDELTRATTGVEGTNYKDWTATGASETEYAGNSAGGNDSIQLRNDTSKPPSGIVITKSAGSDVASVTVEWNAATAEKRSLEIYGSTTAYAGVSNLYGDAKGELLGTIARDATTLAVPEGYPYIGILAKGGALYLSSVTVGFADEASLAVTLDKANGFTVDLGTTNSITATAKNGTEPYSYVWTSDTPDLNGTGDTLAIPATLAAGDYTVQVEVTDAESNKVSKQIGFTVAAPLEAHAINIAVGMQNGTVTSDPEREAVKGTQVKLTATATTEGYALQEMTVTYGETELKFTTSPATFEMPDEPVFVGATFVEVKDYATLPFSFGGPWQGATVSGMTLNGLGKDYTDGSAKLDGKGDFIQIKFAGTAGELSYGIKGNSLNAASNSIFLVQESADGKNWTDLAKFQSEDETLTNSKQVVTNEVSASSQFVRFFYDTKGAGNVGIYDIAITSGGPAPFSIALDPAEYFEVEVGEEASIAATPKNAEGDVSYAWTVNGEAAGTDSAVLGLDTSAVTAEAVEVVCTATDGADAEATASVSYKVVAPAQKFTVAVADGILNGTVTTDVSEAAADDTVTVTATPDDGYRLVEIIVNNGDVAVSGNTFVMPADDVLVTATFEPKPVVAGDVLTNEDVGNQSNSYTSWTAQKPSGAEYAGQSAGGSATNPCIQLRSNNSNSGIVITKGCGQNVAEVIIEWNAQSAAGRVVQIYGSKTAYTDPTDLYGDNAGTLLGAVTNGAEVTSVDVAAAGEYPFIGVRAASGALYLTSVTVIFGGEAQPSISGTVEPEVLLGETASATFTLDGATATEWTASLGTIEDGAWTWAPTAAGTFTLDVTAAYDGGQAEASFEIVVKDAAAFDRFTKVVALSDLEEGEYLVVGANEASNYAMTTGLSGGLAAGTAVDVATDEDVPYILTDNESLVWTVTYDAVTGMTISSTTDKYLGYDSTKADNKLWSFDEVSDASTWAVAFAEETALFTLTSKVQDKDGVDRCLRFNYNSGSTRFAGYKATSTSMKDVALFKKGASSPKITYTGDTTVQLPDGVSLQFSLKNYDGRFEWVLDSREGGSIDADGLYTWAPTEAEEVTIKVIARNGELDIASLEVPLTVEAAQVEPELVIGGDTTGVVGQPVTITVTPENFPVGVDVEVLPDDATVDGEELQDEDAELVWDDFPPTLTFTPNVAGTFVFEFSAAGGSASAAATATIVVSEEGPGPQPSEAKITKMTIANDKMTIEFEGDGAQVLLSDDLQTWTPVDGAISPFEFNMKEAGKKFIGVR